ncbi:MAG: isochorismatase family protein [Chlamydiales bacterium]
MSRLSFLRKESTGLWVIDVQEQLFDKVDRSSEILEKICFVVEAASVLDLPIIVTEQYPKGLGKTVKPIRKRLSKKQPIYSKTTFSGLGDPMIRQEAEGLLVDTWILVGIEAHICVLQTAKDLLAAGKQIVVLNDAISARSVCDVSMAVGELRDIGGRISSSETVIYELIQDASSTDFQKILPLIKAYG